MAINFLDGITIGGELTTTGGTYNITTTTGSSSLYLLNLTRTTTSLTTVGSVGIGTTSPSTKLHISAASSNSQLTLERTGSATGKWAIHTNTDNLFFNNVYGIYSWLWD